MGETREEGPSVLQDEVKDSFSARHRLEITRRLEEDEERMKDKKV